MTPNQFVIVIARPINLNMSPKFFPYSLRGTRLPKRIRNAHPRNYYDIEGKDIDVYFSFLSWGIIFWIEWPWPENPMNTYAWHTETLDSCFNFIRSHQQCIPWSPPLEFESVTEFSGQSLKSEFSFSWTSIKNKLKKRSLTYYLC